MKAIYQRIKSAFLRSFIIDAYCKVLAKIEMKRMNLSTSLWFFKRSMYSLCGKEGVINAREVYSNGGYKYYQIDISKYQKALFEKVESAPEVPELTAQLRMYKDEILLLKATSSLKK